MIKLLLFDGNALVHRAFHALPKTFTDKQGRPTGAVYGFFISFLAMIERFQPSHTAVAFDLAGPTFRDQLYQEYKAKRPKPPQQLYDQIPIIKQVLRAMEVPILEAQGFEADDVLASVVARLNQTQDKPNKPHKRESVDPNLKVIIVTGDQDALQMVNNNVTVAMIGRGIKDTLEYTPKVFRDKFGFEPGLIVDLKALMGDTSDNIAGVPGIGAKGAGQLIRQFQTIEQLYRNLADSRISERTRKILKKHQKEALFSKMLITLRQDAPTTFELQKARLLLDQGQVRVVFNQLGFKSLLPRLPTSARPERVNDRSEAEGQTRSAQSSTLVQTELESTRARQPNLFEN